MSWAAVISGVAALGSTIVARKGQKKAQGKADSTENALLELAARQDKRAQEMFDRYQRTYVPLENEAIGLAQQQVNPAVEAGLAASQVERQAGVERGALTRSLARRGINPQGGEATDAEARLALATTLARAGAATNARRNAADDRIRRLADVLGMGGRYLNAGTSAENAAGSGLSDVYRMRSGAAANADALAGSAGANLGENIIDLLSRFATTRAPAERVPVPVKGASAGRVGRTGY